MRIVTSFTCTFRPTNPLYAYVSKSQIDFTEIRTHAQMVLWTMIHLPIVRILSVQLYFAVLLQVAAMFYDICKSIVQQTSLFFADPSYASFIVQSKKHLFLVCTIQRWLCDQK